MEKAREGEFISLEWVQKAPAEVDAFSENEYGIILLLLEPSSEMGFYCQAWICWVRTSGWIQRKPDYKHRFCLYKTLSPMVIIAVIVC